MIFREAVSKSGVNNVLGNSPKMLEDAKIFGREARKIFRVTRHINMNRATSIGLKIIIVPINWRIFDILRQ